MADQNSYLKYKRDTRHLIYWIIHASNSVIKSHALPTTVNTTGQLPVSALVPLSKLIAEHISPVPSTIYSLFQSVIEARTTTHLAFQQLVAAKPDPEIEKSNVSHKRFIDVLTEAFKVLGGGLWASKQENENGKSDREDIEEVIFANQFSSLDLHASDDEDDREGADDGPEHNTLPVRPKKKSTGKGKKKSGKRGRKGKGKAKPDSEEASLDKVPLESYRIIEDENGLITEYLMAVYSVVRQWAELRNYIQGLWREVSYGGLNSAIAGSVSNIAIAMVKQTESAVFVEFPGHESYETIMNTITRGDPEKAQGQFHMSLHRVAPGAEASQANQEVAVDIDVKENFMIYAYRDLLDFILDFQKTRSGKPTKPMLSEIRDWDPTLNLQKATKEQRIKWRRAYAINWLYDLINVFSGVVTQRIRNKGQRIILEAVDWSVNGPWSQHRMLYGLNEFAGEVTSLAMQKPVTDIRRRILPHLVFEFQCIVDSLAVSRGWSISGLRGHIVNAPAKGFRPRRDVDLFLDRENKRMGHGYCQAVDMLAQLFEKDAMLHGDPSRHQHQTELLKEICDDFVNWLGESKYMYGLINIPPSRFSSTNPNGLWEYSPFLCGVGLMEALELAYAMSFKIWDQIPEPMCAVHLHNMLVKKGYISQEIGLYTTLQSLFPNAFFADGKAPDSDFQRALLLKTHETGSRLAKLQRQTVNRTAAQTAVNIHGLLDMDANRFYRDKSMLQIYRKAGWIPDRVPDAVIPFTTFLGLLRISQTKHIIDPTTNKKVLEDTELVRRFRANGISEEQLIGIASGLRSHTSNQMLSEMQSKLPPSHIGQRGTDISRADAVSQKSLSYSGLLDCLKLDLFNDISGRSPLSSENYLWVTIRFMMLFMNIEDELKELRNPTWVRAYEQTDPKLMLHKRVALTAFAMAEEDEECMEVMAKAFQNPRAGFLNHIYWEDLDDCSLEEAMNRDPLHREDVVGTFCSVM